MDDFEVFGTEQKAKHLIHFEDVGISVRRKTLQKIDSILEEIRNLMRKLNEDNFLKKKLY